MTEAERLKLAEERRLIFENVANGVATETIMAVFRRSRLEVQQEVEFVSKKIREYRFRRLAKGSAAARFLVPCSTYAEIRANKITLLETLRHMGPDYLTSELILPRITSQKFDNDDVDALEEVAHRVTHA